MERGSSTPSLCWEEVKKERRRGGENTPSLRWGEVKKEEEKERRRGGENKTKRRWKKKNSLFIVLCIALKYL